MAMTSSSILNLMTTATGPKISSWAHPHIVGDVGDRGGLHKAAPLAHFSLIGRTAAGERGPFLLGDVDVGEDLTQLSLVNLGAHLGVGGPGITQGTWWNASTAAATNWS